MLGILARLVQVNKVSEDGRCRKASPSNVYLPQSPVAWAFDSFQDRQLCVDGMEKHSIELEWDD